MVRGRVLTRSVDCKYGSAIPADGGDRGAFERFTDDGRMFFRLPMKSYVGRYVLKGSDLVLSRPNQAGVVMKIVVQTDELSLSTGGRTTTYRRDEAGPWYDRERLVR